jgi:internalin A
LRPKPNDALTETSKPVDLEALRRYFAQLKEAGEAFFYEAKLLIIGEGGAGKTSLARKLQDPAQTLPEEKESTEGIAVIPWQFDLPPGNQADNYQVNIWDFGGQEVYFATHQFFLTRRSVYVLVADTRQQHTDFYEWLRMQETFGGDSPVILLKNRNRQKGNRFTIENLPQLHERFANLQKEAFEIDLEQAASEADFPRLQQTLERLFLEARPYRPAPAAHLGRRPQSLASG